MTSPKLDRPRKRIDRSDRDLLKALAARFEAVEEIGRIKASLGLPPVQKSRWKEVLSDRLARGSELGLSPKFVRAVFGLIHEEAVRIQDQIQSKRRGSGKR